MLIILLTLTISAVVCQFSTELYSISKCLGNCALCQYNELDVCVGDFFEMCLPSYAQHSMDGVCVADSIFAEQKIIIDNTAGLLFPQLWKSTRVDKCYYKKSDGSHREIAIFGLFESSTQNILSLPVKQYYQNMVVSFNLIRNSWIPYVDFIKIEVYNQDDKQMASYIIQFLKRQNTYDSSINTIICKDERLILQKFQINVDFKHFNVTKVRLKFKGLMIGQQLWGFTDFKIAFGCKNNLYYSGGNCFNCQQTFYIDQQNLVDQAPVCHQCPLNCLSCSHEKCFLCAKNMIPNGFHCDANPGYQLYEKAYHPNDFICGIHMLHSFQQSHIHKQVIQSIGIKLPHQHKTAQIMFDIYITDTQWNNQSALIIEVDGKQIKRIRQKTIHNRLRQKCKDFKLGYFSHMRIVTPYFEHFNDQMSFRIYSADQAVTDFGISDVSVLVQLDDTPRVKPLQVLPKPIEKNTTDAVEQKQPLKPLEPKIQPVIVPDTAQVIEKKKTIEQVAQIKNQVVISHNHLQEDQKNGEMLISINYPIEIKNYPFIYCQFVNNNLILPGKMVSSTNHLQIISVQITKSIIQQTMIFYMSAYQKALSKRHLQNSNQNTQENNIQLGRIYIKRYDLLDITQVSGLGSLRVFFLILAWIFLIGTIICMMIGKGGLVAQFSNLLQVIFLHIYINGQYLPLSYKTPISGLMNMQNLNYFPQAAQDKIQKLLLGNVVQQSPLRFSEFSTDINFSRAIYPIILINIFFILWFGILKALNIYLKRKEKTIPQLQQQNPYEASQTKIQKLNVYISKIVDRPLNFWYFVLKYQFLAVVWLSLLQFFNLYYPKNADRNQTINAIYCIISFIATLAWPIGAFLLIRHYYHTQQYHQYMNNFEDIFYFQLYQRSLPSNHHQYYIVLGKVRLILYAVCCSYLGNSPIEALIILLALHILSIVYLRIARPIVDEIYRRLFYSQYGLLIVLQVIMLITHGVGEVVEKKTYFSLGFFMVSICILLVVNALSRIVYMIYRIKTQHHEDKSTFKVQLAADRAV